MPDGWTLWFPAVGLAPSGGTSPFAVETRVDPLVPETSIGDVLVILESCWTSDLRPLILCLLLLVPATEEVVAEEDELDEEVDELDL